MGATGRKLVAFYSYYGFFGHIVQGLFGVVSIGRNVSSRRASSLSIASPVMAPKPLNQLTRKPVGYVTGPDGLHHRPELAKLVMDMIATWSIIEARLSNVLVKLLGAQARPAMAMFSALTSSQAQIAALKAAAITILPPPYRKTFEAAIIVLRRVAKKRHMLAHWIWAYSGTFQECLLLIDPSKQVQYQVSVEEGIAAGWNELIFEPQIDGVWVYTLNDLIEIALEFNAVERVVWNLLLLCYKNDSAETAHHRLLNEPRIQKELARATPQPQPNPAPPP